MLYQSAFSGKQKKHQFPVLKIVLPVVGVCVSLMPQNWCEIGHLKMYLVCILWPMIFRSVIVCVSHLKDVSFWKDSLWKPAGLLQNIGLRSRMPTLLASQFEVHVSLSPHVAPAASACYWRHLTRNHPATETQMKHFIQRDQKKNRPPEE